MGGREEANTKFTFVSSASSYMCILIKKAVFCKKTFGEKALLCLPEPNDR